MLALALFGLCGVGQGWGGRYKGTVVRTTYPQSQLVYSKARELYGGMPGVRCYESTGAQEIRFPAGESLRFRAVATERDFARLLGGDETWIMADEVTLWSEPWIIANLGTVVRSAEVGIPLLIVGTTNPYGDAADLDSRGVRWVHDMFIKGRRPGTVYDDGIAHVPFLASDNPALKRAQPDYWKTIAQDFQYEPAKRAAWAAGLWPAAGMHGAFGDLWDPDVHVLGDAIADGQELPRGGRYFRALDWGESDAWAVLWIWIADGRSAYRWSTGQRVPPRGSLVVVDELYGFDVLRNRGLGLTAEEVAERVRDREDAVGWHKRIRVGPGDLISEDPATAKAFRERGVPFVPWIKPPGSRTAGFRGIRGRLLAARDGIADRIFSPLFFSSRATHTIRTLNMLVTEPGVSDIHRPPRGELKIDHLYDALRYASEYARGLAGHRLPRDGRPGSPVALYG
jgi:hypothetical protein